MKDKLKDFVNEHRQEFDVFEPRPELWQQICHELPPEQKEMETAKEAKVIRFNVGNTASFSADFMFMRVAAAILLLLGCGLSLVLVKQNFSDAEAGAPALTKAATISTIAPELVEVEAYYTSQLSQKKKQLNDYDRKVLGLDENMEIDRELARLDSSYLQLKKQLYTTPNTDKVVSAMIQNLQIRIKVLNRQLEVLKTIEKQEQKPTSEPKSNETTNV